MRKCGRPQSNEKRSNILTNMTKPTDSFIAVDEFGHQHVIPMMETGKFETADGHPVTRESKGRYHISPRVVLKPILITSEDPNAP